ncbi:MAG: site-specific integrase [Bacteroidaceae bacterium]|nr:site-specific integrase [Bacteroidaceae bacterium]
MSNIEKLPSGSYRYTKQIDGRRVRITFDHDPSERDIMLALADKLKDAAPIKSDRLPFEVAARQYINLKRNVLSPSTVREYGRNINRLSESFVDLDVYTITQADIQAEINRLSKDHAPKTVRNYHGFISAVIKFVCPDFVINTTLPQKVDNEPYIPTDEEVKRFLQYIKEKQPKYYCLMVLAMYGLRRSEIMAITPDDLDGNTLSITKALVQDENKNWVIKTTKTQKSARKIEIPQDIADSIRKNGYAFSGQPSHIKKTIDKACEELDIPHFTLHKLRHYFASKLLSENVDIITVMALGGWSSTAMLNKHYAHAMEEKKKSAVQIINSNLY